MKIVTFLIKVGEDDDATIMVCDFLGKQVELRVYLPGIPDALGYERSNIILSFNNKTSLAIVCCTQRIKELLQGFVHRWPASNSSIKRLAKPLNTTNTSLETMEVAYILIQCRHGKLKIASNALKRFEEIEELHEVYGNYDIIAKVVCTDRLELKSFIQNRLQITEGIKHTETLLANDLESV